MDTGSDKYLSQKAVKIKDGVFYTGAFDPDLRIFDIVIPTANGTTYNLFWIYPLYRLIYLSAGL